MVEVDNWIAQMATPREGVVPIKYDRAEAVRVLIGWGMRAGAIGEWSKRLRQLNEEFPY
jgi:hypothetical protein